MVLLKNGGYNCWCNPPYGREIGKWVEKAATSNTKVVMLLPARTDTKWFHEWILHKADIYFIKGRLKFGNSKNCVQVAISINFLLNFSSNFNKNVFTFINSNNRYLK